MAYVPHYLLSMSGTLGDATGPHEIFSIGQRYGGAGAATDPAFGGFSKPFTPTSAAENIDACVAAVQAFWTSTDAQMWSGSKILSVKLNRIGGDGKYMDPETVERDVIIAGAGSAPNVPYTTSLVVSHLALGRGPRKRGRVYLPMPATPVQATGRYADANLTLLLAQYKTLVTSVQTALGCPLIVASSSGVSSEVVEMRCGNVPDTQRRRRNALVEAYRTTTLP